VFKKLTIIDLFLRIRMLFINIPEHINSGNHLKMNGSNIAFIAKVEGFDEYKLISNSLDSILNKYSKSQFIILSNSDFSKDLDDRYTLISPKDFDIFGFEKPALRSFLKGNNYDLMISFVMSIKPLNKLIISRINSGYKLGLQGIEDINLYDLTINNTATDIESQLEQYEYYISNLNINK
jgi:hypothetical protein